MSNITILAIIAIFATAGLFTATISPIMTAFAIHNDEGHQDKASVGECKRLTGESDFCQSPESKEAFKEFRKN